MTAGTHGLRPGWGSASRKGGPPALLWNGGKSATDRGGGQVVLATKSDRRTMQQSHEVARELLGRVSERDWKRELTSLLQLKGRVCAGQGKHKPVSDRTLDARGECQNFCV